MRDFSRALRDGVVRDSSAAWGSGTGFVHKPIGIALWSRVKLASEAELVRDAVETADETER